MSNGILSYLEELTGNVLVTRLIEALIILAVGGVFLYLIRKILEKISTTAGVDTRSVRNMYKLLKTASIIVIAFLVLYTLTQASIIVLFILAIIIVMTAASWEAIASLAAYYVILTNRRLGPGDYIEVIYRNERIAGRIREINPFFTVLESPQGVYSIPNIQLLRTPTRVPGPSVDAVINIRVWGIDDPDTARAIVKRISEELPALSKPIVPSPRHLQTNILIDEITSDSITLRALVPLPSQKLPRAKFNQLLEDLAVLLRETGYSFSISLEAPET